MLSLARDEYVRVVLNHFTFSRFIYVTRIQIQAEMKFELCTRDENLRYQRAERTCDVFDKTFVSSVLCRESRCVEAMFIEVRRLMNFISDENVIAGLHVVEGYALARRQMFDRAAQAKFRMHFIFLTKQRQQHPQ